KYLTETDFPWLSRLLEEGRRLTGKRRSDFIKRFSEPMPFAAPKSKLSLASDVIIRSLIYEPVERPSPTEIRSRLFRSAAPFLGCTKNPDEFPLGSREYRARIIKVALPELEDEMKCDHLKMLRQLYSDIPDERTVSSLPEEMSPLSLSLLSNSSLIAGHLRRSHHVRINLYGEARRVVRQAKLRGLLCLARKTDFGTALDISGPLSVIHHTRFYGRALSELVPFLSWCNKYQLVASYHSPKSISSLLVLNGDPLLPAPSKPGFDSKVEKRFSEDFLRATRSWDLIREPEPLETVTYKGEKRLIFPDFSAVHRIDHANKWLIEIIGFWTPGYLASKIENIKNLPTQKVILCIDDRLSFENHQLPNMRNIIRFKKKVNANEILGIMESYSRSF
ncbi:MAG: DUF790 family protein, partial [Oligoflexales bacterium]|nr:DUF790 family protein [Oligoflexales bacterium]